MVHKKQHYVAECYLNVWCDPDAPKNQTPYVWIFSKDGSSSRRKAPENIFHETDMYTIQTKDGDRDLRLEHGLARLETDFTRVRNQKLNYRYPLDEKEHIVLCAFLAATLVRTPSSRTHYRAFWEQLLHLTQSSRTATPGKKKTAAMPVRLEYPSLAIADEQVRQLYERPIQGMLVPLVSQVTPSLARLDMAIFETDVTSDHPCVWFDAQAYKRPPLLRGPSLAYNTIEITLPISPGQCVFLNRGGVRGYRPTPRVVLNEINRRTRSHAGKYFVVSRNETRPDWFDAGDDEPDS